MKTTYELNAPQYATHYRLTWGIGIAIYYHIDNAIFVYDAYEGWREIEESVTLDGLIEIEH